MVGGLRFSNSEQPHKVRLVNYSIFTIFFVIAAPLADFNRKK